MKSGSSAFIASGGHSAETFSISSWYQRSRPGCMATAPPVRRTTSTWRTERAVALGALDRLVGIGLERHGLAAAQALIGGDDEIGAAILDAVRQRIGREAAEDDGMDGADPRAGEHRIGRLGDHRHVDRHAVAPLDAARLQHVGEAADVRVQLAIGDLLVLGRVVALPEDRDLVGAVLQMPVDAVGRDVERAVLEPFDGDVRIFVSWCSSPW